MTENRIMTDKVKSGSKFSGLMAAVKDRQEDAPKIEEASQETYKKPTEIIQITESMQPASEVPSIRRGRPRGKRSDPDFEQVTAYVRSQTHRDVKISLLREGKGREFSELVQELLVVWLSGNL